MEFVLIIVFLLALFGFVMFGYKKNKGRNINKDEAMKDGEDIRHNRANEGQL
jgi:hypothetical protein